MKKLLVAMSALSLCHTLTSAPLVLSINRDTGQIDWLDGFSITRLPAGIDDNRFGTFVTADAQILSPLLLYSGVGSHFGVWFDLSSDATTIEGIGLLTTDGPGDGASFSGSPEGAATPIFVFGGFSMLPRLHNGDYTLPPVGPWSDGIRVVVVPEPTASIMWALGLCILLFARARKRHRPMMRCRFALPWPPI